MGSGYLTITLAYPGGSDSHRIHYEAPRSALNLANEVVFHQQVVNVVNVRCSLYPRGRSVKIVPGIVRRELSPVVAAGLEDPSKEPFCPSSRR